MTSHSGELAQFVEQLSFKELPARVVDATACALVDHLACGLYGSSQPWTRIIAEQALEEGGGVAGRCVIYGREERTNALRAARINGTAAHGFELDDIYDPGMLHPGAVVIPAALAWGTERGIDGKHLVEAVVCGYEVMSRLGLATVNVYNIRAFHSTGTHGPFGSASAAAKISGFKSADILNCWGIASSFSGGTKAFTGGGGMIKRLHAGRAAENGIYAAQLTARGYEGPPRAMDGPLGFIDAFFDGKGRLEHLTNSLGRSFAIEDIYFKPFSCCTMIHSTVQAVLDLKRAHDFSPDQIQRITVGSSKRGKAQNSNPSPTDIMGAQYSLECGAALAALGEATDPSSYRPERMSRGKVQSMLSRTEVIVDDEVDAILPEHMGSRVTIRLRNGREFSAFNRDIPKPADLVSRRKMIEEKFRVLTAGFLSEDHQKVLLSEVDRLAQGGTAEGLAMNLSTGGRKEGRSVSR